MFVIWQRDLKYLNARASKSNKTYLETFSDKYLLVPMESKAALFLRNNGFSYILPDALLSSEQINNCFLKSSRILKCWIENYEPALCPTLLLKSLEYQFVTLFTAEEIAASWLASGVSRVVSIQHGTSLQTNGYWFDSDLPQSVWQEKLGDRYIFLSNKIFQKKSLYVSVYRFIKKIWKRIKRKRHEYNIDNIDYSPVTNSIVVFLQPQFMYRDNYFIKQLKENGRVCIFLNGASDDDIDRAKDTFGTPVYHIKQKKNNLNNIYIDKYINNLIQYIQHLPCSCKIISEYITVQHSNAIASANWLEDIFSTYRPLVACSSQTIGVMLRYYERICLDKEIPVLALPHASAQDPRGVHFKESDYYISILAAKFYEKYHHRHSLSIRTCSLKNIFLEKEYCCMRKLEFLSRDKPIVLFLFDDCQFDPGLVYYDGPTKRLQLLRAIDNAPNKISNICNVYYKLHPAGFGYNIIKLAGVNMDSILPLDCDLGELLNFIDIAISVNYASSPTQQVIMKNIPIVHLNTTKYNGTIRWQSPMEEACYKHEILFAFSVEELWDIIYKILTDSDFKKSILENQNKLKSLFSPRRDITLSSFVSEVIRDKNVLFSYPISVSDRGE